jgi:hypothetical protein
VAFSRAGGTPPPLRNSPGGGGRGAAIALLLVAGAALVLIFLVRSSVSTNQAVISKPATPMEPAIAPAVVTAGAGKPSPEFIDLRSKVIAKAADGVVRLGDLEKRAQAVHDQHARWNEQRGQVENLRQRLGQARVVAEEEGRWPTRAAGRTFDRAQMKAAIDRTDAFLVGNQSISPQLEAITRKLTTAIAGATEELENIGRVRDDVLRSTDQSDGLHLAEMLERFTSASARFDRIVNDPALNALVPPLPSFELEP